VEEHDPTWGGTSASVQPLLQLNSISGNTSYGLQNTLAGDTNAIKNWWGSVWGPWSASHTAGDKISGGATSNPWCTNSARTEMVSFPSQVTPDVTAGLFAIPVGSSESSTPYIKAAVQVVVNVTQGAATHTITVPTGVSMTSGGGGSFSTADLVAAFVEPAALSGFATGTIVRAGLHWGLTGGTLDASSPITIRLYVGPGLEGLRLNIARSVTGNSGWTGDGIDTASAPVSGGYVTFEASKTSYYAAITHPLTTVNYTVTASVSGGHGTVSPATQMVNSAGTATVNISADAGYHTASVRDNGTLVTPTPTTAYTIRNMIADHTVVVTFASDNSTWYLAEGSTAWGFSDYISIENPNTGAVHAAITYMTGTGNVSGGTITLPAKSQTTVNPADKLGSQDFSTKITCTEGKTIAVDRTMTWTGPGAASPEGHSSVGVTSPAKTWYLPEGSSAWGFECWLLIQNPNASAASCTVTYMIEGAAPVTRTHTVAANTRMTFNMADDIGSHDASIKVTSNVPVIPERAMYRNNRREGHDSIGTTSPAEDYFLAEGTTAWGFTTYVLVQNPNADSSFVALAYMTPEGPVVQEPFLMPPYSRKTIRVNDLLSNTDFSTNVHSDRPIIAERAMYWGEGTELGEASHDSIGLSAPHTTFYLPDGETSNGRETWTLVQNPNSSAVTVEVSYLKAGGGAVSLTSTVPANARQTFNMADKVPSGRASITVKCTTSGKKIMVERAMYWNNRGAGTDTIGGFSD